MKFEITCPIKAWELMKLFDYHNIESGYPNWNPTESVLTVQVGNKFEKAQEVYDKFIKA